MPVRLEAATATALAPGRASRRNDRKLMPAVGHQPRLAVQRSLTVLGWRSG
jgi:hypothetical protein